MKPKVYTLVPQVNSNLGRIILLLLLSSAALISKANNVNISDVKVVNNGGGDVRISFDLSWDNSWRVTTGQTNYDGVWVFFKFRRQGTTDWRPLNLSGNNPAGSNYSIYQAPLPSQIPIPYAGAIIYRSAAGQGTFSLNDVQLGTYPSALPYNVDIKAFAIEMVYIPGVAGIFMGDGDGTNESVNAFHYAERDNEFSWGYTIPGFPLFGTRTDPNSFDDDYLNWENGKQLYITDTGYSLVNDINARNKKWPTAQACWCMKYEISQGGYRDFLNSLTRQQQTNRTESAPTAARGTVAMTTVGNPVRANIKIDTPATATLPAIYGCDANGNGIYNENGDGENVACGYLSWPDVAAYLMWSGLSPMTEVEYERIAWGHTDAGLNQPVYGAYAWGNSQISGAAYTIGSLNANGEVVSNLTSAPEIGNANYKATSPKNMYAGGMPLRDGIFAAYTGAPVTRAISGASFFGVMELSGNLSEPCVTLGNTVGRSFTAVQGNGWLDTAGFANYVLGWPGGPVSNDTLGNCLYSACPIQYSTGTILRGGNYSSPATSLRVANRSEGQASEIRKAVQGGRGVLYVVQ